MLKNIAGALLAILGAVLLIGCPSYLRSANDLARDGCNSELASVASIVGEALFRGVPVAVLVQTFCKIPEIVDLWLPPKPTDGRKSAIDPKRAAVRILTLRGELGSQVSKD
jgi:hypothetical protein